MGFSAGFVVRVILGLVGAGKYAAVGGLLVGIPVGMWVVKAVIGKDYSGFRIALVSTSESVSPAS